MQNRIAELSTCLKQGIYSIEFGLPSIILGLNLGLCKVFFAVILQENYWPEQLPKRQLQAQKFYRFAALPPDFMSTLLG